MSTSRRGGLEITSPQQASPSAKGADAPRAPGTILFDLVMSNESLWATVDPHAAQEIVENALRTKGVVDLGDLLSEVIARKTEVTLARGTVLTFAMELARAGIAVRLPPELQGVDRASRQALVDKFRSGQKREEEPTRTMSSRTSGPTSRAPSASSTPPRGASGPSRAASGPNAAASSDGWAAGLNEISDSGARKNAAASLRAEMSGKPAPATPENSGKTERAREKTKTSVDRRRPAGDSSFNVAGFGPARIAMVASSVFLFGLGFVLSPSTSNVSQGANTLPRDIPCASLDRNGTHYFCIVDAAAVSPEWTATDLYERKTRMLDAAKTAGAISLTFYNSDFSRWDPAPAPPQMQNSGVDAPFVPADQGNGDEPYQDQPPPNQPSSFGNTDEDDDDGAPSSMDNNGDTQGADVQLTTKPSKKKKKKR